MQGQPISVDSVDILNKIAENVHKAAQYAVLEVQECSPLDAALTPSLSHDFTNAPEIRMATATVYVARLVPPTIPASSALSLFSETRRLHVLMCNKIIKVSCRLHY